FLRIERVFQVHDHHDGSEVPLHRRRHVDVTTVEIEAMHAFAARGPAGNLARFAGSGDVIDADPSKEVGRRGIAVCAVDLVIDDDQTMGDLYLVRMGAGGHADVGELPAMLWIPHIDNGRTVRAAHMADIGDAIGRDDLPTAGTIKVPDLANANSIA